MLSAIGSLLSDSHVQPLPASPSSQSSHLQKPTGDKSTVDLRDRNSSVEYRQSNRKLITLVKVRKVKHHLRDKSSLQYPDNRTHREERGPSSHSRLRSTGYTPEHNAYGDNPIGSELLADQVSGEF